MTKLDESRNGATTIEAGSREPAAVKPLAGLRVLDFGTAWAGPHATETLAALGADVVKVESRRRLDLFRAMAGIETTPGFNDINLSKRSICIDLSTDAGRELAQRLCAVADVAVDNYRPGVMTRLGLDYQTLCVSNPRIICASVSAFGATGPEATRTGYAAIFCAMGGLAQMTGYPDWEPALVRSPMDLTVANASATAILAAVWERDSTGVGGFIDVSATDVIGTLIPGAMAAWDIAQVDLTRRGNRPWGNNYLQDVYRAQGEDSWVAVSVWTPEQSESLSTFLAAEGLGGDRCDALGSWIAVRTSKAAASELQDRGIPAVPTSAPSEIVADSHLRHRAAFADTQHPVQGSLFALSPAWIVDGGREAVTRAPLLGEHTSDVLREWLGLGSTELEQLTADGVLS